MNTSRYPNFMYIGTSKAGSTWTYNLLNNHPEVFMAPGKGTYFFDAHFERGYDWYLDQFKNAGTRKVVGEVSHSYLFSVDACRRIAATSSDVKLMVCLREPVDRAFSSYLDHVKNGKFKGSFEQALEQLPQLIDRGRYATHLQPYLKQFGDEQIHVGVFDELTSDPTGFAAKLFEFLEIEQIAVSDDLRKKRMPAGTPRYRPITQLAKLASRTARKLGMNGLVGTVKTSVTVRNLLYRPYTANEKPKMSPETRDRLRDQFHEEVSRLDIMLKTDLLRRWGYSTDQQIGTLNAATAS